MNSQQLAKGFRRADKRFSISWKWSVLFIAITVIGIVVLFPVFAQSRQGSHRFPMSSVKQLASGIHMYAQDHDEHLPLASSWMDLILPYTKNEKVFVAPLLENPKPGEYGIAFFKPLSGIDMKTVVDPESVPLVFESQLLGWNAASSLSSLPNPPRYEGSHMIGFLDGHARSFKDEEIDRKFKLEFVPASGSSDQ